MAGSDFGRRQITVPARGGASVTVVVSVYDRYERGAVLETVLARWQSQTVVPEVLLSEQTADAPQWAELARALGVRHVLSRPDKSAGEARYDIGRVRNAGIAAARGRFLYMTDADVYPLRPDYLARLHARARRRPDRVWYRPRMYRLAQSSVDDFLAFVTREGAEVQLPVTDGCLCSFADGHIELQAEERGRLDGWDCVLTPEDLALLRSETFDEAEPELLTKPEFHWGGTFLPRDAALKVAGYAEGYFGWGYEDEDFHTKLAAYFELRQIASREVVHFEHPRRYNNAAFAENERRYLERMRSGAAAMIKADQVNFGSLFQRPADRSPLRDGEAG